MTFDEEKYFQRTFTGLSSEKEEVASRVFEECEFKSCTFIETRFVKCVFLDCKFIECVLSAVKLLNSRFSRTGLHRCKAIGIDWPKAAKVDNLEFQGCKMDYSNFRFMKLPGTKIVGCEAKEVDFIEADLKGSDFRGTDFEKSVFFKTDLSGADFRNSRNYGIDVRNNTLKGARFSFPEVMGLFSGLDIIIE